MRPAGDGTRGGVEVRRRLVRAAPFLALASAAVVLYALLPEDLLHRLSLRQFVDQLVEIADLPHQRVFHTLDAHAAHHAGNQRAVRVYRRRLREA